MVAFHHTQSCFGKSYTILLGISPVLFFFVLSGFVLSRSLLRDNQFSMRYLICYIVKRFFRLYPAIIFSLTLAIFAAKIIYYVPSNKICAPDWLYNFLKNAEAITLSNQYMSSFLLSNVSLDNPLWSIRVEFLCSLLLPFLIMITQLRFCNLKLVLFTLSVLVFYIIFRYYNIYDITGFIGFIFPFYFGFFIAYYEKYMELITNYNTPIILLSCLVVFLLSCYFKLYVVLCFVIAMFLYVLVPCRSELILYLLNKRFFLALGKISYSFYLIHSPVLLSLYCLLSRYSSIFKNLPVYLSTILLFLLSGLFTAIIANISERFIEMPFNTTGHIIAALIEKKELKVS